MFAKIAIAPVIGAFMVLQAFTPAFAEVSQADQDRAAMSANQAAAAEHEEVAREAGSWQRGAEIVRDVAIEVEKALIEKAAE